MLVTELVNPLQELGSVLILLPLGARMDCSAILKSVLRGCRLATTNAPPDLFTIALASKEMAQRTGRSQR
jgi:hypothetical protein